MRRVFAIAAALCAGVMAWGCSARRDLPETAIGWHSPGFTVVYGRLQQLPGAGPEVPPVWTIRFGGGNDLYQGQLALTGKENFMLGYSGGEMVQLRGRLFDQPTTDAFNGRWYVVDSIQMWSAHR